MLRYLLPILIIPAAALANDVWVDFTSDFHDGSNGAPNGVADWIDELNQATSRAAADTFSASERAQIEANIVADLSTIFSDYDINFVTSQPAGEHDVIYMARDNDHPNVSASNFGSSPADLGNQDTHGYSTQNGDPGGVPKVTTANFNGNLEPAFDTRAEQIEELSTALAGTTAHELGHSFGLLHHFTYSNAGISPNNYANTGGAQNNHIMGTGSTGLSEAERESIRSLSPFSRVVLDISGGGTANTNEENNSLVTNPIIADRTERDSTDAGDDLASATPLRFEMGQTSGLPISFLEADIDSSTTDIDVYSFSLNTDAVLLSHVFSERLDLGNNEFDSILELLDANGDVIFSVDDTTWDDDQFVDLDSPEDEEDDPFLVNIPLESGDYYLRVSPATDDISDDADLGDEYWLVTSLELATPSLPGDYNGDGTVDAADYTVWRDADGTDVTLPYDLADGDGNGTIDTGDYTVWSDNYGRIGSRRGLDAAVPEPTTLVMLLGSIGSIGFGLRRR